MKKNNSMLGTIVSDSRLLFHFTANSAYDGLKQFMLDSEVCIQLTSKSKKNMKILCFYLIIVVSVLGTPALADTKRVISVEGYASMSIPIDLVLLTIDAKIEGDNSKMVENNGYQMGVDLKNVLKKYGVSEKHIANSSVEFNEEIKHYYKNEKKSERDNFVFHIRYSVLFDKFKWIDDFRKDCIEVGVVNFKLSEIFSKDRKKYEDQLQKMAFNDAKVKAKLIVQEAGFKLGMPVSIDISNSTDYANKYDGVSFGLGPSDPYKVERDSLFQQQAFYITQRISVNFSIK